MNFFASNDKNCCQVIQEWDLQKWFVNINGEILLIFVFVWLDEGQVIYDLGH